MTVLHLITGLETGGAEMMMYKLVTRSDCRRFRHIVVSLTRGGPIGDRLQTEGFSVHQLGIRRGAGNLLALWSYRRLLKQCSPDLVQTWLYHADLLGVLGSFFDGTPLVWNIQASEHPGLRTASSRLCVLLSHRPVAVIVNSETGRRVHEEVGYHPRFWFVVPNGFDTQVFAPSAEARSSVREDLALPADTPLVGMMARYHPQKDHATFLEAARLLSEADGATHFVLTGRGVTRDNAELRQRIDAAGLGHRVHLLGERSDVERVTAALDVAALSACFGEGFPGVVCEAMACGVPVVATDVGDIARIVGGTGRVVPPRCPRALADAWRELLALPAAERQCLGLRARARVVAEWSIERIVDRYESVYQDLAHPRSSGHALASN